MLIGDDWLFIQTPRTASWSTFKWLSNFGGRPTGQHHAPASSIDERYADHFKIGGVRNPWDRLVSLYCSRWNRNRDEDFLTFLRQFETRAKERKHLWQMSQRYWLADAHGEYAVDWVVVFEALPMSLEPATRRLGLPTPHLPHLHRVEREPYQTYYCDEARQLVAEACSWEIDRFHYDFEAGVAVPMQPHERLAKDLAGRGQPSV